LMNSSKIQYKTP